MSSELQKRKANRLPGYDYSSNGAYFVTVCTRKKRKLFWENVGASIARPQEIILSAWGRIVDQAIREIPFQYPAVKLDKYVVMPNHIHLLLQIQRDAMGGEIFAPSVSTVIAQLKGRITKEIGVSVWQKSFHDHVVRNEKDYLMIWQYIDNNSVKWNEDCFYFEDE